MKSSPRAQPCAQQRDEHALRPLRRLAAGQFTRTSSLADLAHVAALGLTSRVARRNSIVSLDNLSDAFSDAPEFENPVIVQGG